MPARRHAATHPLRRPPAPADGASPRITPSPLTVIPGVGVSIAADLNRIGIHEVTQLQGEDPQRLYDRLCAHDGVKHDRCLLYVFRCAVYYASHPHHEPEKLKWWHWKSV